MKKVSTVDDYIAMHPTWHLALTRLRQLAKSTGLLEEIKWGYPVFTLNGKHVFGLGAFKSHCGIWFFQGVFLSDPHMILVNAQDGKTKALRQMRFHSENEIQDQVVLNYMNEAVQNQKDGKELKPERDKSLDIPGELLQAFKKDPALHQAFKELTAYKQREYAEYILEARRHETKYRRLEKITPMILKRLGLHDAFRNRGPNK